MCPIVTTTSAHRAAVSRSRMYPPVAHRSAAIPSVVPRRFYRLLVVAVLWLVVGLSGAAADPLAIRNQPRRLRSPRAAAPVPSPVAAPSDQTPAPEPSPPRQLWEGSLSPSWQGGWETSMVPEPTAEPSAGPTRYFELLLYPVRIVPEGYDQIRVEELIEEMLNDASSNDGPPLEITNYGGLYSGTNEYLRMDFTLNAAVPEAFFENEAGVLQALKSENWPYFPYLFQEVQFVTFDTEDPLASIALYNNP